MSGWAVTCPVCGEQGNLHVIAPTGHAVVVHPGAVAADGRRWADEACILSQRQAEIVAAAREATGADL